jgi:hypothetical protein
MAFCYGSSKKEMRKVKNNLLNNSKFRTNRRSDSHALLQGVNEFLPVVSKLLKNNFEEIRYKILHKICCVVTGFVKMDWVKRDLFKSVVLN